MPKTKTRATTRYLHYLTLLPVGRTSRLLQHASFAEYECVRVHFRYLPVLFFRYNILWCTLIYDRLDVLSAVSLSYCTILCNDVTRSVWNRGEPNNHARPWCFFYIRMFTRKNRERKDRLAFCLPFEFTGQKGVFALKWLKTYDSARLQQLSGNLFGETWWKFYSYHFETDALFQTRKTV